MLIKDGYVNIVTVINETSNDPRRYINHTQISSTYESGIPSYDQISNREFIVTTNSSYDFTDEALTIYFTDNQDISNFTGLNFDNYSTIETESNNSFSLFINNNNLEHSISLSPNQVYNYTNSIP